MHLVFVHLNLFHPLISGRIIISCHTWAEGITRQLLNALPFTDGSAIEWRWVGTAARAFLVTTTTAAVAHRPLCPCWPSTIHWKILKCYNTRHFKHKNTKNRHRLGWNNINYHRKYKDRTKRIFTGPVFSYLCIMAVSGYGHALIIKRCV